MHMNKPGMMSGTWSGRPVMSTRLIDLAVLQRVKHKRRCLTFSSLVWSRRCWAAVVLPQIADWACLESKLLNSACWCLFPAACCCACPAASSTRINSATASACSPASAASCGPMPACTPVLCKPSCSGLAQGTPQSIQGLQDKSNSMDSCNVHTRQVAKSYCL